MGKLQTVEHLSSIGDSESGKVAWQSPSNIALVKYWGKKDFQIPKNASISFTLDNCNTKTALSYEKSNSFELQFTFESQQNEAFEQKVFKYIKKLAEVSPELLNYTYQFESENTFPHSSGIASSASAMSAIALCLSSMLQHNKQWSEDEFFQNASNWARMGSGSACRSTYGGLVVWGKHPNVEGSSDLFGKEVTNQVHDVFKSYQDTVLLVDEGQKTVSSTAGHALLNKHPFAEKRFETANNNLSVLLEILNKGELKDFIKVVESEALMLHALMMSSDPYYILMKPNTLQIIEKIWDYREQNDSNVCITLDAGANVHMLYPEAESVQIQAFTESELLAYCQNGKYICDSVGFGPAQIKRND